MRIMAIDFGDARTGVAVSDPMGMIVGQTFVIESWNADTIAERIRAYAAGNGVERIVLGLPKNMNGTEGERAQKCREFGEALRTLTGLEVIMWDERRSTIEAHDILRANGIKEKKHRKSVDAVAASLILEGYLRSI